MKEELTKGSALPGIMDDLKSLEENFPDMANKIKIVREKIEKMWKNGKKTTRGNEHVSLILNMVNEIIKNSIKGISEEKQQLQLEIPINKEKEKYNPQIDLHFNYNNIHIFLECKYWLYDTNQMRSAILNSILLKEYGNKGNSLFYIIGGGNSLFNKNLKLERKGKVLKPLISFALDKNYIKGIYGIQKLKELINEIKNQPKDSEMRNK